MKITIVAVGKIKEKFYQQAIDEFLKRLSKYCKVEIIEVADEKTPEHAKDTILNQIKDVEGERILRHLKKDSYLIALAIEGKMLDSEGMAEKIEALGVSGQSHIAFVIGGSLGISDAVKRQADLLLSFSKMTFPHQLMRVILLEQVYRSFRIIKREPYHK